MNDRVLKEIIKECSEHPQCTNCPYYIEYTVIKITNNNCKIDVEGIPEDYTPKELKEELIKNKLKKL